MLGKELRTTYNCIINKKTGVVAPVSFKSQLFEK